MAKLTPIEKLDQAIQDILDEYAGDVDSMMREAVPKVAKKGVAALKQSSPRSKADPEGRKHYADNWAVKNFNGRLSFSAVIYNQSPTYRVAHLLEHGHAKRGGGRVAARVHIKPVEEKIINEFEKAVEVGV